MALTGSETLQVLGQDANGQPAATTETTTTGAISSLAGSNPSAPINVGATHLATIANANKIHLLNTAAGSVLTLPNATGSGAEFTVVVDTTVTSNAHKILAGRTADYMQGNILTEDSGTMTGWNATAAATYNSVAMNGSTTGGFLGDKITFTDIAANLWQVNGITKSTGTAATPFSTADS